MPRIEWSGLPPALRDHLFEREGKYPKTFLLRGQPADGQEL